MEMDLKGSSMVLVPLVSLDDFVVLQKQGCFESKELLVNFHIY